MTIDDDRAAALVLALQHDAHHWVTNVDMDIADLRRQFWLLNSNEPLPDADWGRQGFVAYLPGSLHLTGDGLLLSPADLTDTASHLQDWMMDELNALWPEVIDDDADHTIVLEPVVTHDGVGMWMDRSRPVAQFGGLTAVKGVRREPVTMCQIVPMGDWDAFGQGLEEGPDAETFE